MRPTNTPGAPFTDCRRFANRQNQTVRVLPGDLLLKTVTAPLELLGLFYFSTYTIAALAANTVSPRRNSTLLRAISSGFFESSTVIGKTWGSLVRNDDRAGSFFRKPSGGLQDVEKAVWPHSRIDTRLCDLVRNRNFAVSVLLHVNGNLRIINTLFWRSCASMASLASLLLRPPTRT